MGEGNVGVRVAPFEASRLGAGTAKARILIADDHEMVRRGLRKLLESEPGFEVVGEAVNGREAVEKAKRWKPAVVVVDISMPELNGMEATGRIVKQVPGAQVLILTMHESEELARQVLDSGARGYVLKTDAARYLVQAVKALRQHKTFFTPSVAEMMRQGPPPQGRAAERLTPREREIIQLLAEGKSVKDIAVTLAISVSTAETHRSNIMRKLRLHSISDLVRWAIRNKIIQP